MRAQILAQLIAKFLGVSEQVLSRIADKLAKTATTDELVTTAVEGVTIQTVIESQADYRANEATINAVLNYEKKHGLTNGLKATGGEPTTEPIIPAGTNDDTPAWAKALIDSNKALNDKFKALEGAKVTDSRRQKFDAIIANLPDNQKTAYKRTSIDSLSDEDFESLITDVTAEVGVIEADAKAKGSVFTRPVGGGGAQGKEPSKEELDAAVSQMNV